MGDSYASVATRSADAGRPMSDHTPLGSGAEFDMIRAALARLGARSAPAGDDCALIDVGGRFLAVSSDLSVERTHFRLGWMRADEIGERAAAAALSDLAAVAADPVGVLVSVAVSPERPADYLADLMEGAGRMAHHVGGVVLGGDVVRSDRLVLDVTAIGWVDTPLRRVGARPGDGLYVTGRLGGPAAALAAWEEGEEPRADARERFARPIPRVAEARWLAMAGATAGIDLSDGLVPDAAHLAAASGVQCRLDLEAVPLHPAAPDPGAAAVSGEEYELLVAIPPDPSLPGRFEAEHRLLLTRVGEVGAGAGVKVRGGPIPEAYHHFGRKHDILRAT